MQHQGIKLSLKILAVVFISINTFFITYHLYFAQRLIPGIYVGSVRIGGLSIKDAKTVLVSQTPNPETKIFFGFKNFTYETTLNEETIYQALNYHLTLKVKYIIITNGMEHYCLKVNDNAFEYIDAVPAHE